ncbi:MAG: DNA internalization-related competence protein ComEC/Rec2 [Desulfuromonadales bacterium]|nr:DNA internalization-related competence protein ComEC/Rec2 [Desulfuromonadales bacterium]
MAEGERPLLIPCLALSSGIVLADLGLSLPVSAVAAIFFCLILSCAIRHRLTLEICTFLFFLSWGVYVLPLWTKPPMLAHTIESFADRQPHTVEGIIRSRPVITSAPTGTASSFNLEVSAVIADKRRLPINGTLMMYVRSGEVTQSRGDLIRLVTKIAIPHRLGLPGEFDFARFLSFQGVVAIGSVATAEDIVLMRGAVRDVLLARIDREARRLGDCIRASLSDVRVSSVLTALLVGDQKRIPPDLSAAYTRAGVNHILSISGFHVGIIALFMVQSLLLIVTRFEYLVLRFNLRRAVLLPALPAMLIYLLLSGTAPATARSVAMLAVFVLALYVERESDPINALLISAMLLLAVNPTTLFDLSFQLSFLALWGMCLFVPPVMAFFTGVRSGWLRSLLQFSASSCAASLATVVPVLFFFNQASFNGILSNFLIVPLLGYGAVVSGFCGLLLSMIHTALAQPLLWVAGKLVFVSNWLIVRLGELPLIQFHGITRLDMLAFVGFMCLATFVRPGRPRTALCILAPSLAVMVHLAEPSAADGRLHITMLSVGQAESLLIRLPEGSTLLVDGGGYLYDTGRDFGERTLAPALFRLGVHRIDYLVMTHSHPDHNGGLPHIARTFPVGEFWEAAPGGNGPFYEQLRAALALQRTPRRLLAAGDVFALPGGVSLRVLSPLRQVLRPAGEGREMDQNENSLVFRISHGAISCLCTADAGFSAEQRMLKDGVLMASTVLKVGHHGSRFSTSGEFLDRVTPRVALISAGQGNSFGLPASRTLALLHGRGICTYRTDLDGTIELVSDGATLRVATPYRVE